MLNPVKVKICGITNLKDAYSACSLGADALGFNFYSKSPRYITPAAAARIIKKLPPFIKTVGVFVKNPMEEILNIKQKTNIDSVQLHGDENIDFIRALKIPVIKVLRLKNKVPDYKVYSAYPLLLDAYSKEYGGTGKRFLWDIALKINHKFKIIAGGLTPDNIVDCIIKTKPYGVDAASGVEKEPGVKDKVKLKNFIEAAKSIRLL